MKAPTAFLLPLSSLSILCGVCSTNEEKTSHLNRGLHAMRSQEIEVSHPCLRCFSKFVTDIHISLWQTDFESNDWALNFSTRRNLLSTGAYVDIGMHNLSSDEILL